MQTYYTKYALPVKYNRYRKTKQEHNPIIQKTSIAIITKPESNYSQLFSIQRLAWFKKVNFKLLSIIISAMVLFLSSKKIK